MSTDRLKLTAYFGERLRSGDRFAVDTLLDLFATHQVSTSVVLRGVAGFGPRHQLRTDVSLSLSEDPPVTVTAFDTAEKLSGLATEVVASLGRGLVTLEWAGGLDDTPLDRSAQVTVVLSRGARVEGRPAYVTVGERLRAHGFAAATAYCGVDGTTGGHRRRATFFGRNREVPAMVLAVGPAAAARAVGAELDTLPGVETVCTDAAQLCKVNGQLLARPALPAPRQRLILHTAASDLHRGLPVHRAAVRALLDIRPTAGLTVLHGIWGFQGDRPAHADRLFQLGRGAPVTTVMVDTADRISAAFDIIDGLTGDVGVVSVGAVPAAVSIDDGEHRGSLDSDL
ncbi:MULTISPECIES: DUF190 domain-containing protein [Mycobacteriaceae]|uniref:DUF190 domain-containing protein n=1 Tax=Mycobacteriaceae TaxID=1762 RepID=UPI0007FFF138|nr:MULTISPECIES: DUF190 domain-containing protein [Mycobacteriaceae]MCK0174836.1 DUF190 domain-containing protein [Mycolicibacterium sp. F2034L]OBB59205.1 hypothetical protein A5757_14690 [Mycobacterium sp. 852013-51886_SCH5428379]